MRRQAQGEGEKRPMDERVVSCLGVSLFTELLGLVDNTIDLGECRRLTKA